MTGQAMHAGIDGAKIGVCIYMSRRSRSQLRYLAEKLGIPQYRVIENLLEALYRQSIADRPAVLDYANAEDIQAGKEANTD